MQEVFQHASGAGKVANKFAPAKDNAPTGSIMIYRYLQKQVHCVHEWDRTAACMCADAANVVQGVIAVPGLQGPFNWSCHVTLLAH